MPTQKDIVILLQHAPTDLVNMISLIREKGLRYYGRPLFIAAISVIGVYYIIYKGPVANLAKTRAEISNLSEILKYTAQYRDLESLLQAYYARMPHPKDKDRDRWLTDVVHAAMIKEGVDVTSFSAAAEQTQKDLVIVSINVICKVR